MSGELPLMAGWGHQVGIKGPIQHRTPPAVPGKALGGASSQTLNKAVSQWLCAFPQVTQALAPGPHS